VTKKAEGRMVDGEWRPTNFTKKHGSYYWIGPGKKWNRLDKDYSRALSAYFQLISPSADDAPVTIAGLILAYRESARELGRSPHTLRDYERWGDRLIAVFGHMPCESLKSADTREYIRARMAHDGGLRQIEGEVGLLSAAYNYARKQKWFDLDPLSGFKPGTIPSAPPRVHTPTCDDISAFWGYAPPQLQAYLSLKLLTSARQEDILALRIDSATELGVRIHIQKAGKTQIVEWSDALHEAWSDAMSLPRQGSWLIENRKGEPYVDVERGYYVVKSGWHSLWQRTKQAVIDKLGDAFVPFKDVDLRAYVAQKVYSDSGKTVGAVKDLLGHVTPTRLRSISDLAA